MFKLLIHFFDCCKAGRYGWRADLNFLHCMLASVTGKEGGLVMAALEEWSPSSNSKHL